MKKEYTYRELHNKAVTNYHKMMMAFLFVGILNFIGAVLGSIKGLTYFPSLVSNILLFNLLSNYIESTVLLTFVNVLISIIFSAIFVLIWSLTKVGKFKAIIWGLVIYLIDTILMFIFFINDSYLIPQILLHLLMIGFITVGITNYYHVFAIERKFKK